MNTDSNIPNSTKSIADNSWKATTSNESLRNIAISAGVAAVASWAVQASGSSATLEKGKDYAVYKPDPNLMLTKPEYRAFVELNYPNYNGVIDPTVNNIGIANTTSDITKIGTPVPAYSTNPFTADFWQGFIKEGGFISSNANKVGGMNGMATMHDPMTNSFIMSKTPILEITIPPTMAVQYCSSFPAACGVVISKSINNDYGTKK